MYMNIVYMRTAPCFCYYSGTLSDFSSQRDAGLSFSIFVWFSVAVRIALMRKGFVKDTKQRTFITDD